MYAIEYYNDFIDYPEWEELHDWSDNQPKQLRFETAAEAQHYINEKYNSELNARALMNAENSERQKPHTEIYNKRKACLGAAGLWKQDWESFSPLTFHSVGLFSDSYSRITPLDDYRVVDENDLID